MNQSAINMAVDFCGVRFKNPLIAASTDYSRTQERFTELLNSGAGGIITKSVTDAKALQSAGIARFDIRDMEQKPLQGAVPDMYTFFSRGGSMVSMEQFRGYAGKQLEEAAAAGVVLIGSISASKTENWVSYAKEMEEMGFPMLELNFGNPHGEAADGKLGFLLGQSKELCCDIVGRILAAVKIPVIVKLTPQISDMVSLVKALFDIGAKAVTVMHRYQGLVLDIEEEAPALGGWAAVGGPWMKPISLGNISKVYRNVPGMEICGGNGVNSGKDLIEYMLCGAGLVQVGSTMMLKGAEFAEEMLADAEEILRAKGETEISALIGRAADKIVTYKSLGNLPQRSVKINFDLCRTCEDKICVRRCYFGTLREENGELKINEEQNRCPGCGMCVYVCPKGAAVMEENKEEE